MEPSISRPAPLFWSKSAEVDSVGQLDLLVDASSVQGAVSAIRGKLTGGKNGAHPHFHTRFSEILYVLSGKLAVLGGSDVVTAEQGDLLVIPPELAHAFCAPPDTDAEYLLLIAPGIDRFEYHRTRRRIRAAGIPSPPELQTQYDNHNIESTVWTKYLEGIGTAWG